MYFILNISGIISDKNKSWQFFLKRDKKIIIHNSPLLEAKMKGFPKFLMVLGRLFIGLIFIMGGISKTLQWQQTEKALSTTLSDWHSHMAYSETFGQLFANLLLWVPALLIIGVVFELLGGVLVFFSVKVRFGAVLLILFLVPTTILVHQFWFLEGAERTNQAVTFLKNLAILGGILCVLAVGGRRKTAKPPSSLAKGG